MTDPTPPTPKTRTAPAAPVGQVERMMRALALILTTAPDTPFKTATRDLIQEAPLGADLLPAVVFDDSRLVYEYQDAHNKGRVAKVSGVIVFDIQGEAKSHGGRGLGFKVGEVRNALVHALATILYNNRRLEVQLPECGEETPQTHCLGIGESLQVQHVPEQAPLTRSLVSATVTLVETLDQRVWAEWSPGLLEGAPLGGVVVEASLQRPEEEE